MTITYILTRIHDYLYYEIPIGPKEFVEMRHVINLFKGGTIAYLVLLMWWYQNFSTGMYLYLGLHGSYGVAWLFKDYVFGDKSFAVKVNFGCFLVMVTVLTLYWMIGWSVASGYGIQEPSYERIKLCLIFYLLGLALMLGADAQKTFTLQYKKGLIASGYFERTRNPNYLGEVMIYGAFGLASGFWLNWVILLSLWLVMFQGNMLIKDNSSLMKKPGWAEYSARSYLFLPKLFGSHILNALIYTAAVALIVGKFYGVKYSTLIG